MATGDKVTAINLDTLERAYVSGAIDKQIQSVERAIKAASSDRMRFVLKDDLAALHAIKARFNHG